MNGSVLVSTGGSILVSVKEYARGDVHETRAECLFSLLKSYLRVFRGVSKTTLPGYIGFFQFLRNFHQLTAFEQAEMLQSVGGSPRLPLIQNGA